jgi:hypothetical protein
MEDLIAFSALAIEYVMVMLVIHYPGLAVPFGAAVALFVFLAFIGFGVWDKKTAEEWRKLTVHSVILGIGFSELTYCWLIFMDRRLSSFQAAF